MWDRIQCARAHNLVSSWVLLVPLLICPTSLPGQDGSYFAVMGGTSIAVGDGVGPAAGGQVGLHLSGRFNFGLAFDRLRGQIEITYDRFREQSLTGTSPALIPIIFTLSVPLVSRSRIQPYLAAGAGAYYYRDGRSDDNKFGFNGGVGLLYRLLLAEIRYHYVLDRGDRYLSVAVGVRT